MTTFFALGVRLDEVVSVGNSLERQALDRQRRQRSRGDRCLHVLDGLAQLLRR